MITVLVASAMVPATHTDAFSVNIHEGITFAGLSEPGINFSFLRPAVLDDILDQHEQLDSGFSGARDERHFDDCEFDGAAEYIRDRYGDARHALAAAQPWSATDQFGNALHPAMDFYSHSNWVEMGFPRADNPATSRVEVSRSDLVDLSGAAASLAQPWAAPDGGGVVRSGIRLGGDDWSIPLGWSIDPDGGGRHVPTLVDASNRTQGRLLVTGEGTWDDECDVPFTGTLVRAYDGLGHDELNKDGESRPGHDQAVALATLQTSYEWCRLVREAGLANADGLLLATWVRSGGNPHPTNTPCAAAAPGPTPVAVTIDSIRILDSGDDDDYDPGEIQIAAVLYDDPANFRRSVHVANTGGRMPLDDGALVPTNRLPPPMLLCVGSGKGATLAVHGWDNDDDSGDLNANDFDDIGDDDELLVGFQRRFGSVLPTGQQVARSADLEVRYRVSRGVPGPTVICPSEGVFTE